MRFPKNRANLYLVQRINYDWENTTYTIVGGFPELDAADDYKDACKQEWLDKVGNLYNTEFKIVLTTFYEK